jgi:hypothetical protein
VVLQSAVIFRNIYVMFEQGRLYIMVEKKKSESRAEFQSTFPVQGQAS